ncbi:MAG: hypothetical protein AB7N76_15960 [Planctomycetota bacterium]
MSPDSASVSDSGSVPDSPSQPDPQGWWLLLAAIAAYLLAFAVYYPPTHAIEDEVGFLNMSLAWSRGALTEEGAGLGHLADFDPGPHGRAGWRNPGRPLVTVPFWWLGGYRATFAAGALIHVALTLAAACALRALGRSAGWALLVLLHPTLILYSRAVMSDELGGLGVAAALWLLLRRRPLLAGLALGLGCAARYQVAVLVPFLAAVLLRHDGRRGAAAFLAGVGVWGLALVGYDVYALGHPLGPTRQGFFALAHLPRNLVHYGLALGLLWPGMLLAPFAWLGWSASGRARGAPLEARRAVALLIAAALPLPALLLVYYWFDQDPQGRLYVDLVVGQRLLQPVLAAWVLLYAAGVAALWPARRAGALRGLAVAVALGGSLAGAALQAKHQRHLAAYAAARAEVEARVPAGALLLCNRTLGKLFEVPTTGPDYRLRSYEFHGRLLDHEQEQAAREPGTWFLAHLAKADGAPPPPAFATCLARHPGARLVLRDARLVLYAVPPPR